MSKIMTAEERYARDPHFHGLVHQLYNLLVGANYTATELREALILALIQYEQEHPRPLAFSSSDAQKWASLLEPCRSHLRRPTAQINHIDVTEGADG